jgi:hypothetical protein
VRLWARSPEKALSLSAVPGSEHDATLAEKEPWSAGIGPIPPPAVNGQPQVYRNDHYQAKKLRKIADRSDRIQTPEFNETGHLADKEKVAVVSGFFLDNPD